MDDNNGQKFEYDIQKRAKAGTTATFRGIVCAYIAWLGIRLIRGAADEGSTLPVWAGWLAGIAFIAAAAGFGFYIWKRWRLDVEAARLPETEAGKNEEEPPAE